MAALDNGSSGGTSMFSLGLDTYRVSVEDLFVANRRKLVRRLREAKEVAAADGGLVFLEGGPSAERFDTDHEPVFRQESYFLYLTGVREPDCLVLIDLVTDQTTLFVPRLPEEYATFMGRIKSPDEWRATYLVDDVQYVDEAIGALESRLADRVHDGRPARILLLRGRNSDSGRLYEAPQRIVDHFPPEVVDTATLFPVLAECRVVKSPAEQSLLRHVTEVTSLAHVFVMQNVRAGMMEYQAESLFRHYCYYHFGCRLVGYTPICGCGPNAAILHYGHAGEPNARQIRDGDICLFDMGSEYFGYGSDVTCSFPISGVFDGVQRTLYSAVLNAQIAVYNMMRPGVSYVDCHKRAEACVIQGLVEIGAVVPGDKTIEELVEMRLGAVFMPHGLGHFIGIDTHDVGGYLEGHSSRPTEPGLDRLRTARILQEGMTLTVEPGCYIIDHLLNQALGDDSSFKQYLNPEKLNSLRGFGGIRLEDVVLVTESGCTNYTLCPRTIAEVESVMAGAKWPPMRDDAPELCRERLVKAHLLKEKPK